MPEVVGVGAIFIDDIVLPSGKTYMGQLGGGVTHALMGAALWDCKPGISAVYGDGLPDDALARLQQHFDTTGLIKLNLPQMRAWQIFEEDGLRRELYRVVEREPFFTGATFEQLPEDFQSAQGIYLLQGIDTLTGWVAALPHALICWEPLQQAMIADNKSKFRQTLRTTQIDIVSPNLEEARAIYGPLAPVRLIDSMLADGAQNVALRMGPQGSLLKKRADGSATYIPAIDVDIIDQTGAGNTYCGAYLLGLVRGKSSTEAGCMATVAASFCIEQQGVLNPSNVSIAERHKRLRMVQETVS